MPLKGKGVLMFWNGVSGGDDEFLEWHVKEHIPERVGLPGFERGRRYVAMDGEPAYCNFYEVRDPLVLFSDVYIARLNDPTPWTKAVVSTFVDTMRTICDVTFSGGIGAGAYLETLRFSTGDKALEAQRKKKW